MFYLGHVFFGVGLLATVAELSLDLFASHADGLVVGRLAGNLELVPSLLILLDLLFDIPLVLVDAIVLEYLVLS